MDIIVSAKNFDLTPSIKQYTEEKVGKVAKYWNEIIRARVELVSNLTQKVNSYTAEGILEIPGKDIRVTAESSDMHAAIDELVQVLERRVKKAKGIRGRSIHALRRARDQVKGWFGTR